MPVKRGRYPTNWDAITAQIRARAGNQCECVGECGLHPDHRCIERNGEWAVWAKGRVILTVHHLDADTTNNEPANLLAMCQRCHLRCDTPLHVHHAHETRRKRRAVGELPGLEADA